ncbi:MAG: putative ABC exporter domain-containing protein [Clostridia bacterium]|nr:putative ABC exporter domain-containing protein [Clostridia bacterium]
MRILPYYIIHTVINSIKKLFRTWVAIILAVCLGFGLIGGVIGFVMGTVIEDSGAAAYEETVDDEEETSEFTEQDKQEMLSLIRGAIILITFAVILLAVYSGDKSGTKIFTMPDVNFLFASPLPPQSVLMFRTVIQMGIAIVSSVYILFQIPNLVLNVGLSIGTCLCIFLAYFLLLYLSRITAVFTYTVSATSTKLKRIIKPFVFLCFLMLFLGFFTFSRSKNLSYWQAFLKLFSFETLEFIPIFGWFSGMILSAARGAWLKVLLFAFLLTVSTVILTMLIWKIKADFYEDALSGASEAQKAVNAANGETVKRKKERSQKIARNGEIGGLGASVFFGKTIYNRRRFAKLGIFTPTSVTYTLIALAALPCLKLFLSVETVIVSGFGLAVCIFFRNLGNPLADEMSKPFIYTVPESPHKKILFSMVGGLTETALDLSPVLLIGVITLPKQIPSLLSWFVLWLSLDVFCSSVGLFTELALPQAIIPSIKAMLGIFIRMFAVVPGLVMLIISAAANIPLLLVLTVVLNSLSAAVLLFITPLFLHSGKA